MCRGYNSCCSLPCCYSFQVLVIGTNVVVVSTDHYCTNCGVPSATSICASCLQRRKCHACHRRLEDYFFASSHTCHACARRKAKPKVRQAVGAGIFCAYFCYLTITFATDLYNICVFLTNLLTLLLPAAQVRLFGVTNSSDLTPRNTRVCPLSVRSSQQFDVQLTTSLRCH